MPGTILIVDDVATNRIVLKVKLTAACYRVAQAVSGGDALAYVRNTRPEVVLLDVGLPDIDGIAVLRALRADPATCDLPVLMFTAAADRRLRLAALAAGADGFLDKPFDDAVLLARIRSLLRDRPRPAEAQAQAGVLTGMADAPAVFAGPAHVALLASRPEAALRLRAALAPHLSDRLTVTHRDEALAGADRAGAPDLYVIADDLGPSGMGLSLLADLRSRPGSRDAAFCVVMPDAGGALAAMAFDLGAGDVLADGCDGEEAAARLRVLIGRKRAADALRIAVRRGLEAAAVDPLTGLWNRRYALPVFARMTAAAALDGRPCATMLLDVDRFKRVNDGHGHAAGDAVLAEVAARLQRLTDPAPLVARIGGEEFLIALPDTSETAARALADRICAGMAAKPFALPGGGSLHVTVSIGIALSAPGLGPDALLAAADRALLSAKADGRNQVTFACTAA